MRVYTVSVDSTYLTTTIPSPQPKMTVMEEFTGAACQNCPEGHKIVADILASFPNQVVALGYHPAGNNLSEPVHGGQDFRTDAAKLIADKFGVNSLPSGIIDRKTFDGTIVQSRATWKQNVGIALKSPVKINVKSSISSNSQTGSKVLELEVTLLEDIANDLNLSIMLIENKLDAPQKDGGNVLEPYEHEHVLRKTYTNAIGDLLQKPAADGEGYKKGRVFLKKLELDDFAKTKYKEENLYIVSFVSSATNSEIYQASQVKVKQ